MYTELQTVNAVWSGNPNCGVPVTNRASVSDVADVIGVPHHTARKILNTLEILGVVSVEFEWRGRQRRRFYSLTSRGMMFHAIFDRQAAQEIYDGGYSDFFLLSATQNHS